MGFVISRGVVMTIYLSQIFIFVGITILLASFFFWFFAAQELRETIKRRLRYEVNLHDRKSIFVRVFDIFGPLNYFIVRRFVKRDVLENKLFGARAALTVEQFFGAKEMMLLIVLFLAIGFMPKEEALKIAIAGCIAGSSV